MKLYILVLRLCILGLGCAADFVHLGYDLFILVMNVGFGRFSVIFENSYLLNRKSLRVVPPIVLKVVESSYL